MSFQIESNKTVSKKVSNKDISNVTAIADDVKQDGPV